MRALALLLLLLASARAGEAPADPRQQAWAAHRAGEADLSELRRILAGTRGALDEDTGLVREAALDTLIRLRAHVPWEELKPHLKNERMRVFILAVQHPEKNRAALRELLNSESLSFPQWTAVCNLLTTQKAPGLAAHLLAELEVRLDVHVVDADDESLWGFGGAISSGSGDGRLTVREGWPPRTYFSLTESAKRGVLLAPGVHPIYVRRKVVRSGTGGIGSSLSFGKDGEYRLDYIAALLGTKRSTLPLDDDESVQLAWCDARAFTRDVLKARHGLRASYGRIAAQLQEKGLLTKEEAAALDLRIETVVHDHRADGAPALPAVP